MATNRVDHSVGRMPGELFAVAPVLESRRAVPMQTCSAGQDERNVSDEQTLTVA